MKFNFKFIIFLYITFFATNLFSEKNEQNVTIKVGNVDKTVKESNQTIEIPKPDYSAKINLINDELKKIEAKLKKDSLMIAYSSYLEYQKLTNQISDLEKKIAKNRKLLKKRRTKNKIFLSNEVKELEKDKKQLKKKLDLRSEYKEPPFDRVSKTEKIKDIPTVTNPFSIIAAFSYIKHLKKNKLIYQDRHKRLQETIKSIKQKQKLLGELYLIKAKPKLSEKIIDLDKVIEDFEDGSDYSKSNLNLYMKKADESILMSKQEVNRQVNSIISIVRIILVVIILAFLLKFLAKRYIEDNERVYKVNKTINILNITIIFFILLFSYIDNQDTFVKILGFASAGLAIAMKDYFMSILGWFVIMLGGSYHVGDRIKVKKDGLEYVGDIVDTSLLHLTMLEDVTLTSYMRNRRAGRIIFVPNNFIFSSLIANYTHQSIKTVWDGIDIMITFDSNHKKAAHIAKEITRKYSKGYTDISRKQLNKLRNVYSLKNTNVDPKILSFVEPHGICISCWYMTNSYATLTLRSTISTDILDAFRAEKDINIAYPTQTLRINRAIHEFL